MPDAFDVVFVVRTSRKAVSTMNKDDVWYLVTEVVEKGAEVVGAVIDWTMAPSDAATTIANGESIEEKEEDRPVPPIR